MDIRPVPAQMIFQIEYKQGFHEGYRRAMREMPEIVHCKDCKHYCYYGLSSDTVSECTIGHCETPDGEWFCADGERKSADEKLMEEMDADPLG